MSSQKRSFFYNLAFDHQVYMLRKTEHMTSSSLQLAEEMSAQLKLPVDKISAWLKQRRKRTLKVRADTDVKISTVKSILLSAEFARNKEIDEVKALVLAYLFDLSKKTIICWYKKRLAQCRFREKQRATKCVVVEDKPKPKSVKVESSKSTAISSTEIKEHLYGNQKKTPAQLIVLFEAFKKYGHGEVHGRVDELIKQTGLSERAVRDWIKKTNSVVRTKTITAVSKKLRENLSAAQVRELQRQYQKRKYITRNEADEIASTANLNTSKVMQWFGNRRMYELFSHYSSAAAKNGDSGQQISEEDDGEKEGMPPLPPDSGMSRVIIQKSTSKRRSRNRGIPAFKVLRLMKDRRRSGNKKTFSKLGKELGLHEKQISSWLKNKQYREQMIRRAKRVYGDALKDENFPTDENQSPAAVSDPVVESNDGDVEFSLNVESVSNSPEGKMTTGAQHCLFNAYKESQSLSEARMQELSDRWSMDKTRIKNWWNAIGKHMRRKSLEMVEAFLKNSCNDEQREKLTTTYSKSRYYSKDYLTRLAEQIGMNPKTVQSWFINARLYELKTGVKFKKTIPTHRKTASEDGEPTSSLAWPQIQKLKREFEKNSIITDARAKSLAMRLKVPSDKIKEWFENRKKFITECSKKIIDNPTNMDNVTMDYDEEIVNPEVTTGNLRQRLRVRLPKISSDTLIGSTSPRNVASATREIQSNSPLQKEFLFKEFVRGSQLTPIRLQQIALALTMDQKHICEWFSWLRSKVAKLPRDVLLESYRNANLTVRQVKVLESEYRVTPYPDQEKKEGLAQQLGVAHALVKTWFANRRYYEILINGLGPTISESTSVTNDFKPVITSISSAKQSSDEIDVPEEVRMFDSELIERDNYETLLNSYVFSSVNLDEINVLMPQEQEFECAVSPSSSRSRYFEPLNTNFEPKISKNLDFLFWYVSSSPEKVRDSTSELSEADIVVLEGMYETCSEPTLDKIRDYSKRLAVSEQIVYWWFVQRRCLAKTENVPVQKENRPNEIVNQDSVKNVEITKTDSALLSDAENLYENSSGDKCDVVEITHHQADHHDHNDLSTSPRTASLKKKNSISSHQRLMLLKEFKRSNFVTQSRVKAIAADIGLPPKTVESWFRHRRQILGVVGPATALNPNQMVTLELEYRANPKMTKSRLQELATRLNVSLKTIILWFKERKQQIVKLGSTTAIVGANERD